MKPLTKIVLTLLASACSATHYSHAQSTEISGTAQIVDGDTLDLDGLRIRLYGIDAPEFQQTCSRTEEPYWPCGQAAAHALSNKILNDRIECVQKDIDSYRRVVGVCSLNGEDLNAWLVSTGWAIAYLEYSKDYVEQEAAAKLAGLGIWNSTFVAPAEYRANENSAPTTGGQERADCVIKGNINARGERIYHVPDGEFYERTVIDPARGERRFCTERDALAAGWRRSSR